jgi:HPr kinase/phosphorylase
MPKRLKNERPQITVEQFVEKSPAELEIKVLAGEAGLKKKNITSERIQKLGLALAGFSHYIHAGRVQIVGQSEISFLNQLGDEKQTEAFSHLDFSKISCILITKNLKPPKKILEIAKENDLPILGTPQVSSKAISLVTNHLQEALAPHITLHGVLLGMHDIGVLILGESGIGKSECALDLISRGHRLISDDSVCIKKIGKRLEGTSPELTFEHIEIRGLGILNIRDLFGVSAVGKCKPIELCIELKKWKQDDEIERIGLEMCEEDIFGVKIPKVVLPVSSGRNLSTLVETAVRVHLLRRAGFDAAQKLIEKHTASLSAND